MPNGFSAQLHNTISTFLLHLWELEYVVYVLVKYLNIQPEEKVFLIFAFLRHVIKLNIIRKFCLLLIWWLHIADFKDLTVDCLKILVSTILKAECRKKRIFFAWGYNLWYSTSDNDEACRFAQGYISLKFYLYIYVFQDKV